MEAYIKSVKDFSMIGHYPAIEYKLYPFSSDAKKSGTIKVAALVDDISGNWLIFDGNLYIISKTTPGKGVTTITVKSPIEVFNREFIATTYPTTVGGFISKYITDEFINQTDLEYKYPYIEVVNQNTEPIKIYRKEDKIHNLADYIYDNIGERVNLAFSYTNSTLTVKILAPSFPTRSVVFNDGHNILLTSTFSRDIVSKVTVHFKNEDDTYTNYNFYLDEDGTFCTTEPINRMNGKWTIATAQGDDIPSTIAKSVFNENKNSHKIEFYSDRDYGVFDIVKLRLEKGLFTTQISSVYKSSDNGLTKYTCGELATTLTEKVNSVYASSGSYSAVSSSESSSSDITLDKIYPVGSLYWSSVSTDPSTLFGGTWTRIKDKFILAAGDTYEAGATGGEASHTLTINEIPSHDHTYARSGYNTGVEWIGGSGTSTIVTGSTGKSGGGQAHNNMPPYEVYYCWKRTA